MTLSGFSLLCMYALEQRIERRIERPLVKNVGGAVLEFAGCAPLWFFEIRVLPPDGLRGAFIIARDGLHLTALRILHGTTRGFSEQQAVTSDGLQNCAGRRLTLVRIVRSHDRRSSELRAATSDGLQNCARSHPKLFKIKRAELRESTKSARVHRRGSSELRAAAVHGCQNMASALRAPKTVRE